MSYEKQQGSGTSGGAPARRIWEPMSLTRVGKFGDVLTGNTGMMADGGYTQM